MFYKLVMYKNSTNQTQWKRF